MTDVAKCAKCGRAIPSDAPEGACPVCALAEAGARPSSAPSADEVAAKLPGFEILGVLGSGGMGVVFKARQKALDRIVALKVLPPATAATPGFAERFGREARAMARLSHPNIVAVHEFGESSGLYYLVLEFVDGLNVREAMAAGRIRPGEALTIVPQICDALQYAHDRGVVHRDIKPENVLIDRDGRVKIADFGLAKLADGDLGAPSLTHAGQVMGTLHYMAPEQWERPKEVDHRADIYSLGVVFYEMLTGEVPAGRFEPPSKRVAVDVRLDEIVMRSIERDRERRWQNASDVKTKVGEVTSTAAVVPVSAPQMSADPTPPVPSVAPASVPKPSRLPVILPLLAAALLATVAAVTTSELVWWAAGLTAFAALVVWVVRKDRERRGVVSSPQEDEEPEEGPKGSWLPPRTIALVTLAGIFAAAILCGGWSFGSGAMALTGTMFFLGLVLWELCDMRRNAVRDAEKGQREMPGAPVAIEILAGFMTVAGVLGVGWAVFGDHATDGDGFGFGPFGIHVAWSKPEKPADRAPWEFDVETTTGETPAEDSLQGERQSIWRVWTKAQALQGSAWNDEVRALYAPDDAGVLESMGSSQRKASGDDGLIGVPLLPRGTASLAEFRIESARLSGHDADGAFASAVVRAGDGARTMRFAMRYSPTRRAWAFAATPVEFE